MFRKQKGESGISGQGNFQAPLVQMIVDKKGQAFATAVFELQRQFTFTLFGHRHTHSKKTAPAVTCSIFWIYAFDNSTASPAFFTKRILLLIVYY